MLIGLALTPGNPAFGSAAALPFTLAAVIEWWDFRTGGTGAAITSHAGEKGVATLSQSNASYKPIWNAAGYCVWDATNDYLEFTLSRGIAAGQLWIETPYGWYKSGIGNFTATSHRLALPNASQVLLVDTAALSGSDATDLAAYMSGTEYGFIAKTNDLTIYNRLDNSPDFNYTIDYFGANAATYSLASSQSGATIDISAQGLTAPAHVRWPIGVSADVTLLRVYVYSNGLFGIIPSLSANMALQYFYCSTNKLNSIIPSLSANTALVQFQCYTNQVTGSIPSLSANTALVNFSCYANQLTGWDGGTVSNTLSLFDASNNALTVSAVNAILAAFVAAGRATGTLTLNGGTNAAPTGQGITDKATLVASGWSVLTN